MPFLPRAGLWQHLKGIFSPDKKLWGDLIAVFQYLKGADSKGTEGLFIRECSDRKRGNGFKLNKSRFTLDMRKRIFYYEGDETPKQVGQRGSGCPITGNFQGQAGWCSEQPDLLDVSAYCRVIVLGDLSRSLPIQIILWFYDCLLLCHHFKESRPGLQRSRIKDQSSIPL